MEASSSVGASDKFASRSYVTKHYNCRIVSHRAELNPLPMVLGYEFVG